MRAFLKRQLWPSWQQRKRMLLAQATACIPLLYALLIFAYLWPPHFRHTSPGYVLAAWAAFMVRTFTFHLGLFAAVIAVFAWVIRRRRLAVVCLPLVLATLAPSCWQYRPRSIAAADGPTLKVTSVNLLAMNHHTEPLIAEIRAADADILLLQEYTPHWHEALTQAFETDYPHRVHVPQEDCFGMAIYAKYPFVADPQTHLPLGEGLEPQMRAVIDWSGQRIAVYNIHLLPPRRLDYIVEHRVQWADLLDLLKTESLPAIIGGDFNFTEHSPHAAAIRDLGYLDAHAVAGSGRGATWPVNSIFRYLPGLRLDHVYLSPQWQCHACRTGVGRGSDHRPLSVRMSLGCQGR